MQPQKLRPWPTGTVGEMKPQLFTETDEEDNDEIDTDTDNNATAAATNVEEE